ncbi:MAG: hypothetical protein IKA32_06535 [Lentisphaeria bacterium]|nr:hypothetical protein [Lentisphaeria bacterium]
MFYDNGGVLSAERFLWQRRFAVPQFGMARGADLPQGSAGLFYGNGGLRVAGAWRLFMDQVDLMDLMDKMGAPCDTPRVCLSQFGMARGADLPQGVIIAIGAPITQSHNSHNSHNSHIKRRPIDFANRSGYTEFWCKKSPQRYAGQRDGNGGVRSAGAWRLFMDQVDKLGAPVFALMGYAVASLGIPRGFACRSLVWRGRKCASGGCRRYPRVFRGLSGGQFSPPDRSGNAPDRYPAFFAKLFFTRKKSGGATHPTAIRFFLPSFFSTEKKAVRGP